MSLSWVCLSRARRWSWRSSLERRPERWPCSHWSLVSRVSRSLLPLAFPPCRFLRFHLVRVVGDIPAAAFEHDGRRRNQFRHFLPAPHTFLDRVVLNALLHLEAVGATRTLILIDWHGVFLLCSHSAQYANWFPCDSRGFSPSSLDFNRIKGELSLGALPYVKRRMAASIRVSPRSMASMEVA